MTYPVVTIEKAQQLASLLRLAIAEGDDPHTVHSNEDSWIDKRPGHDYEPALVATCASDLRTATLAKLQLTGSLSATESYDLEAQMAGPIHSCLSQLGMDMLEDEDFWRYLALFPFRWYLLAREPEIQPQDFGGFAEEEIEPGVIKRTRKSLILQLILRTYLWGKIAFDEEAQSPYFRATVISEKGGPSIDIWHSHLIRTQLGQLGHMRHSFVDVVVSEIADPSAMKDPARKAEKLIARVKHNVLLDVYSKEQADSITREQLSKV